jgi:hypothetical protein
VYKEKKITRKDVQKIIDRISGKTSFVKKNSKNVY